MNIQNLLNRNKLKNSTGKIQTFDHPVFENTIINKNSSGVDMEAYAIARQTQEKRFRW